jgi:transposase
MRPLSPCLGTVRGSDRPSSPRRSSPTWSVGWAAVQSFAQRRFTELRELGYEGSYPSLARRVRTIRPQDEDIDPVVRFETNPGIQTQVDWTN